MGNVMRSAAATFLVIALVVPSAHSQSVPSCDQQPELSERWNAAWQQMGIAPARQIDPLGDVAAIRWFGARNWFPVDGRQQVLCGRLVDWSLYDGPGHELDLHPYIVPGEGFEHIITELPKASRDNVHQCDGEQPCVYGEVTLTEPITRFMLGSETPNETSKFRGGAACVYGPWVMERVHGWLPEIHPVRQFWAPEIPGTTEALALVITEDSSDRYADRNRFKMFGTKRGGPWSPRSIREVVGFAYELSPGGQARLELQQQVSDGTTRTYRRAFGAASLSVSVPGWIAEGQSEACTAQENGASVVRGIEWLSINRSPPESAAAPEAAGVGLRARRTGMTRPVPHDHLLQTRVAAESVTRVADAGPRLAMEVLELRMGAGASVLESLRGTAKEWVLDPSHGDWRLHGTQFLTARVYYTGNTPGAQRDADELNRQIGNGQGPRVTVTWDFTSRVLDPDGRAEVTIGRVDGLFQYGITASGGDAITTRLSGLARPGRLRGSGEGMWRAALLVKPPGQVFRKVSSLRLSPVLEVKAMLRDTEGRTGEFHTSLHSLFPTFANVTKNAEPPRSLLVAIAAGVKQKRDRLAHLSVADIVVALSSDWNRPTMVSIPARRARIFRSAYLTAVRAGDLESSDWNELVRLAVAYADVRWPLS